MFKHTIIALSLIAAATSSYAADVELTNNTVIESDALHDALVVSGAAFMGTGSSNSTTYVFIDVFTSNPRNVGRICDVATHVADGKVSVFEIGDGGRSIPCI